MADIQRFLDDIKQAVYGEEVRGSIHDAIEIINDVSEVVISAGTAVDSPTSSSTGFFENSYYINTDEWELWKCIGIDMWQSLGKFIGNGIDQITKTSTSGLVDTYTIEYTDGTTTTFTVTNGADGNLWYHGTTISGGAVLPTVYPLSGIAKANAGDSYLNSNEGMIYECVSGGDANTATWKYSLTLSGGGGASVLDDLNDVDIDVATLSKGQLLEFDDVSGTWKNVSDRSVVRYGGSINFADLITYASTYLTAEYEDTFFLLRTGGTIGSGDASAYWTSNFHDGDEIPADAHIAIINVNRGTVNPPVYKYDDFGGFVDISGKAEKSEIPHQTATVTISNQNYVQFTGVKVKATSIVKPLMDVATDPSNPPEVAPIGYKSLKIKTSSVVDGELQADGVIIMYFNGNVSGTFAFEITL